MQKLKNKPVLINYRKSLRKNPTPAESVLWKFLKSNQLEGIKFRRQFSIGYYILDFYCPKYRLAIELDGANHFTSEGTISDAKRDEFLNSIGIRVLRFENDLIMNRLETVLEIIVEEVKRTPLSLRDISPDNRGESHLILTK